MTHIDIPAALRNAAQHVREHRTLNITEALVVSARDVRGLASITAAFSSWLEMTLGEPVVLHTWARSLPVPATLADYLTHAARDIAACRWCMHEVCDDRALHDQWDRASETTIREQASRPANPPSTQPKSAAPGGDQNPRRSHRD